MTDDRPEFFRRSEAELDALARLLRTRPRGPYPNMPIELSVQLGISDHVSIAVVTTEGDRDEVHFRVAENTVDVRYRRTTIACIDRRHLREWMAEPQAPLTAGRITLQMNRIVDPDGQVAFSIPGVPVRVMSHLEMQALRVRL